MKIFAPHFLSDENKYIEIEVSLLPGLPKFTIIGLPDSSLKEGVLRLRAALFNQGFDWPRGQQVVVNLKPTGLKKLNKDLEFAIALAFLVQTQQIELKEFESFKRILVAGDLSLSGTVGLSKSLHKKTFYDWTGPIISGNSESEYLYDHYRVKELKDLLNLKDFFQKKVELEEFLKRPNFSDLLWSSKESRFIEILALGGHSALIGGPQGCGKTTLAKEILPLKEAPDLSEYEDIQLAFKGGLPWRPQIQPHHSIPRISLIGGGVPPKMGEVSRAHRGVLILDEFLEFKKDSIEVLREALQEDTVQVNRLGSANQFKTDIHAIATTNLCPCGAWNGQGYNIQCSRSLANCKSYLNRLVGPVIDRFDILWLKPYNKKNNQNLSSDQLRNLGFKSSENIFEHLTKVRKFKTDLGRITPNSKLSVNQVWKNLEKDWMRNVYEFTSSLRRKISFWQVAQTLSELNLGQTIKKQALTEAYEWTSNDFQKLN